MKHTLKITLFLVFLFLAAHIMGLFIADQYLVKDLPLNIEKPQMNENISFVPIFITILFATVIILIMARFRTQRLWKTWFFLTIIITLTISFAAFINQWIAIVLALILAYFKVFKPNMYVHNFTEVFIYGALAALFIPIFNLWSISILLILVSIYDAIAVWKIKHMIKLAKFQTDSKVFAGLFIPYKKSEKVIPKNVKTKVIQEKTKSAILGGGDIGFTLLFSAVILKTFGMPYAIITSFIITLALLLLFLYSKKDTFYPAMPFLSAGCFIALGLIYLLTIIT